MGSKETVLYQKNLDPKKVVHDKEIFGTEHRVVQCGAEKSLEYKDMAIGCFK